MNSLANTTAIVVGASRGFGRAIATRLAGDGASVVAIARDADPLTELANAAGSITPYAGDAVDPGASDHHLRSLCTSDRRPGRRRGPADRAAAGADVGVVLGQLGTDVHLTFNWLREALRQPLAPGSRVIVFSSGAALAGSPMSGGYAGAKGTQRHITNYAAEESQRAGLRISFTSILPKITPQTGVGRPGVVAYAARQGISEAEYVAQLGPLLMPAGVGEAVLKLAQTDDGELASAYRLSGEGLVPLS